MELPTFLGLFSKPRRRAIWFSNMTTSGHRLFSYTPVDRMQAVTASRSIRRQPVGRKTMFYASQRSHSPAMGCFHSLAFPVIGKYPVYEVHEMFSCITKWQELILERVFRYKGAYFRIWPRTGAQLCSKPLRLQQALNRSTLSPYAVNATIFQFLDAFLWLTYYELRDQQIMGTNSPFNKSRIFPSSIGSILFEVSSSTR